MIPFAYLAIVVQLISEPLPPLLLLLLLAAAAMIAYLIWKEEEVHQF